MKEEEEWMSLIFSMFLDQIAFQWGHCKDKRYYCMCEGPIHGRLLWKLQNSLCGPSSVVWQMATQASTGPSTSNTVPCQGCHPGTTQVREIAKSWRVLYVLYVCKTVEGDALIKFPLLGRDIWSLLRISQLAGDKMSSTLGKPWS